MALRSFAELPADVRHARQEQCHIFDGAFAIFVQVLLFAIVVCTLVLKWWFEQPRRRFGIFLLDSSKQIVGAGAIHVANMLCAMIFAAQLEHHEGDECAWYWVNIMIDTTFGVLVCYLLLKITEMLFGYDSGHYGKGATSGINWEDNPDYKKWAAQICVWCCIVMTMKLIVVAIMAVAPEFWVSFANTCTQWLEDDSQRLVFVMIVTPTVMNMFQFLVTDSFLKFKNKLTTD